MEKETVLWEPKRFETHFPILLEKMPNYLKETLTKGICKAEFNSRTDQFLLTLHSEIESCIPLWTWLRKQNAQATCRHIVRMLCCLLSFDSYKQSTSTEQNLLLWYVLLHDIAKRGRASSKRKDPRDPFHAFGSAAATVDLLTLWYRTETTNPEVHAKLLTLRDTIKLAFVFNEKWGIEFPDTAVLPKIFALLNAAIPRDCMWHMLIRLILLHQSIAVKAHTESFAPLTELEMKEYIDPQLLHYKIICDTCDELSYYWLNQKVFPTMTQLYATTYQHIAHQLKLTPATPSSH